MSKIDIADARIKRLEEKIKNARKYRANAKTAQNRKEVKEQNKKDILYAIYRRSLHADEYERDIASSDFDKFLVRNYERVLFGLEPLPSLDKSDGMKEKSKDIVEIIKELGFKELPTYESITIEQLEQLSNSKMITKKLAIQIANHLGSKNKTNSTKNEIFDKIRQMVLNRDTMDVTDEASMDTTQSKRLNLNVPIEYKDIAKKLGAKWDPANKTWFTLDGVDAHDAIQFAVDEAMRTDNVGQSS